MKRVAVVFACSLSLAGGIALSSGNPADVETEEPTEDPAALEAVEDDAPVVDGVFTEDEVVEETDSKSARIDKFYNGLNAENLKDRVNTLYSESVQFSSPLTVATGRDELLSHYQELFKNVKGFTLEVSEEFISGQETVLLWEATYSHDKLSDGAQLRVSGVSHLTFANDQIVSQRDYFDAGSAIYEHVTLVGRIVRWVKNKVTG